MILISLGLAVVHNQNWLWFTAFIGTNLLQSGLTKWCPMMMILKKASLQPWHRECNCTPMSA